MRRNVIPAMILSLSFLSLVAGKGDSAPRIIRVLTHSSFSASPGVIEAFEKENDVKVQFISGGDAGETLSKAMLARGNPFADVLFGVDNTFLGRALAADIFEPYASPALAEIPSALKQDPSFRLLPVDFGFVTLNYDRAWFSGKSLPPPRTLEELAMPAYRSLLVVENPATSSPGLAFLLATIASFGETGPYTWESFWSMLRANDVLVVNGWNEAYYGEFSASGKGRRPLVVSYATSPAAEVYFAAEPKPAEPPTANISPEGGSFRQVEFVGVLKGAKDQGLARKFVDFMLSPAFQADIPLQMWVYPANAKTPLPEVFRAFAPVPKNPASIDPGVLDAKRDSWIQRWTQLVLR